MTPGYERALAISGVLYAEDFDTPSPPHPPAPPQPREPEIIVPSFSLGELRAASDQARQEGQEAAHLAMDRSMTAQRDTTLAALAEQILLSWSQSARIVEEGMNAIAGTVFSMLAVALPALCATHAEGELRALLHRILPPMREVVELHVKVHPSLREAVEQEVETILEGSGTRLDWSSSSKLEPGDISVTWQKGGALRDTGAICSAISQAIFALFEQQPKTLVPEVQPEAHDGQ